MLDEIAAEPIKGIMLTFDEFLTGVENFGKRIQPLMKSRTEHQKALGVNSSRALKRPDLSIVSVEVKRTKIDLQH